MINFFWPYTYILSSDQKQICTCVYMLSLTHKSGDHDTKVSLGNKSAVFLNLPVTRDKGTMDIHKIAIQQSCTYKF